MKSGTKKRIVVGITAASSVGLIRGQCKYFTDRDYRVYLLAPKSDQTIRYCKEEGCILLPVRLKREINLVSDALCLIKIVYLFICVKPDIVNVGTPKVSLLGMIAARLVGVKLRVYTCRGLRYESEEGRLRKILILLERLTAKFSHKILCISHSVKSLAVRDGLFDEDKTIVIGNGSSNGLDLSLFNRSNVKKEARDSLKETLKIKPNDFVFGFTGRIVDRKGINELYDAFSMLNNDYPDTKLVMVGPIEKIQIKDLSIIERYQNHNNIIMTGKVDFIDVPLYMSIFDCFVLPTWAEGFGNVFIQAAAIGLPIIGNWVTGCKDAVKDGYNGVLIKNIKNPIKLKEQMELLMANPEELKRLGANSECWAKEFDRKYIWENLEKLYLSKTN